MLATPPHASLISVVLPSSKHEGHCTNSEESETFFLYQTSSKQAVQ